MSKEEAWDDKSREAVRKELRATIIGELRLAKLNHVEIYESCDDRLGYRGCPKHERAAFRQFVADEIDRAVARLANEQANWPEVTDCDRLDRVEVALRDRGILLWQVSPCCDTCTRGELKERVDLIESRYPGFQERLRGYAFFIDQNMPEELAANTHISLYLGYGWLWADPSRSRPDEYPTEAVGIAREICDCLHHEGLEPDWKGDLSRKIGVQVTWQRRQWLE